MTKEDWKEVTQVRLQYEADNVTWSFPIKCPRWLFNILRRLEI